MAVYDPALGLVPSLNLVFTRMSLVSANGIVAVNIGLRLRTVDTITAYDYSLSLSNSPALELTCDTSSTESYYHDCRLELFVHITGFDRVVSRTRKVLSWADVAASAGAYFSFVQFVSWIVSAQAFMGE